MYKENHRQCRWFQKALAMPSPAAAACLPLTREVDSPKAKTEGEKSEKKNSLPQSRCRVTAPSYAYRSSKRQSRQELLASSEGALGVPTAASAVARQNMQAKDHSVSLIGSAGKGSSLSNIIRTRPARRILASDFISFFGGRQPTCIIQFCLMQKSPPAGSEISECI